VEQESDEGMDITLRHASTPLKKVTIRQNVQMYFATSLLLHLNYKNGKVRENEVACFVFYRAGPRYEYFLKEY
jgi:hypothetical protein